MPRQLRELRRLGRGRDHRDPQVVRGRLAQRPRVGARERELQDQGAEQHADGRADWNG